MLFFFNVHPHGNPRSVRGKSSLASCPLPCHVSPAGVPLPSSRYLSPPGAAAPGQCPHPQLSRPHWLAPRPTLTCAGSITSMSTREEFNYSWTLSDCVKLSHARGPSFVGSHSVYFHSVRCKGPVAGGQPTCPCGHPSGPCLTGT